MGFESAMRSLRESRKPWSSTIWALMSCSLATQTAAVFLTYGSSSFRHFLSGSHRYSVILSTRMQPMVRTARARIRGLGSSQSCISGWEWSFKDKFPLWIILHFVSWRSSASFKFMTLSGKSTKQSYTLLANGNVTQSINTLAFSFPIEGINWSVINRTWIEISTFSVKKILLLWTDATVIKMNWIQVKCDNPPGLIWVEKTKQLRALPWRSCSPPWWPCQADSWRSSLSRGRLISSAPGCRSACSWPHLGTRNWQQNMWTC